MIPEIQTGAHFDIQPPDEMQPLLHSPASFEAQTHGQHRTIVQRLSHSAGDLVTTATLLASDVAVATRALSATAKEIYTSNAVVRTAVDFTATITGLAAGGGACFGGLAAMGDVMLGGGRPEFALGFLELAGGVTLVLAGGMAVVFVPAIGIPRAVRDVAQIRTARRGVNAGPVEDVARQVDGDDLRRLPDPQEFELGDDDDSVGSIPELDLDALPMPGAFVEG